MGLLRIASRIVSRGIPRLRKVASPVIRRAVKSPLGQKVARGYEKYIAPSKVGTIRQGITGTAKQVASRGAKSVTSSQRLLSRLRTASKVGGALATAGTLGYLGYDVYKSIRGSRASAGGSVGASGVPQASDFDVTTPQGGDGMGALSKLGLTAAGLGGLYGAEQLAERLGVRGGAGFIGDRPMTNAQLRQLHGVGFRRHKTGLFNKRALRTMMKAKSYEKQAVRVLSKRGLVFKKRGSSKSASLDRNEIALARMLYGGR